MFLLTSAAVSVFVFGASAFAAAQPIGVAGDTAQDGWVMRGAQIVPVSHGAALQPGDQNVSTHGSYSHEALAGGVQYTSPSYYSYNPDAYSHCWSGSSSATYTTSPVSYSTPSSYTTSYSAPGYSAQSAGYCYAQPVYYAPRTSCGTCVGAAGYAARSGSSLWPLIGGLGLAALGIALAADEDDITIKNIVNVDVDDTPVSR